MHTETFSFFFFFQTCAQLMKIVENWQSGFWHMFEKFWQISGGLSSAGSYVPLMMSQRKPSGTARAYFSHLCKTSVLNAPSLLMRPTWAAPRMVTALVAQVQIGQEWSEAACWEVSLTPRDLVIRKLIQFQPRSASRFLLLPKQPHKLLLDREWHNSSQPAIVM